ncbi:hypothetical protein [Ahrensia sp. 13_GOM-1096m]|uniref:hypothetical protein n=1 Tax=Ahrensia sp. 13_GOM-1096m TaxID=1380380 RepID=UPI00047C17D4|nr:hypothetical protein [Ahrensia sp. 13_GOM-1096m]
MKSNSGVSRFVVLLSLILSAGAGHTASDAKLMLNDKIALEHLEIIRPLRGAPNAQAYFTIWNGTEQGIYLARITDQSGLVFTLQKSKELNGDLQWQNASMPKVIPPKSEFTAKEGLFRLIVDAAVLNNVKADKLRMLFQLVDGQPVEASAMVLPFGTDPTDHHHGLLDGE